jgi:hypothetical protein
VQLGRALAAVCDEDDRVALAFVRGVLEVAGIGSAGTRALVVRDRLPAVVTSTQQSQLFADVGRTSLRRRVGRVGAVDLDFKGADGWRLLVELKIDAGPGPDQIRRYLNTKAPLVAVVRDPADAAFKVDGDSPRNWLGAVSWESITPILRGLPIETDAGTWNELLDIATADGDLGKRRARSTQAGRDAAAALDLAWPKLVDSLVLAVERKHGKRAAALVADSHGRRNGGGTSGAGVGIALPSDRGPYRIWVGLWEADSAAPMISVAWYPPSARAAKRQLREAHARIENRGFEARDVGIYKRERSLPASAVRELGLAAVLAREAGIDIAELGRAGVLAVDIERLRERR